MGPLYDSVASLTRTNRPREISISSKTLTYARFCHRSNLPILDTRWSRILPPKRIPINQHRDCMYFHQSPESEYSSPKSSNTKDVYAGIIQLRGCCNQVVPINVALFIWRTARVLFFLHSRGDTSTHRCVGFRTTPFPRPSVPPITSPFEPCHLCPM